jgi:hypothetical protein
MRRAALRQEWRSEKRQRRQQDEDPRARRREPDRTAGQQAVRGEIEKRETERRRERDGDEGEEDVVPYPGYRRKPFALR